jgi:hypothetical protein
VCQEQEEEETSEKKILDKGHTMNLSNHILFSKRLAKNKQDYYSTL